MDVIVTAPAFAKMAITVNFVNVRRTAGPMLNMGMGQMLTKR